MRRKDGDYIWVEGTYRYMPEDNGVLAVMRDVTARKQAEDALAEVNAQLAEANRALEALALRDGLTGLANRRGFDAQLAEEWRRAGRQRFPIALVLFDIDCFKLFNDCYGHLAGDDCLRQVCDAVVALARRPGDFAARYGGEELAVLLPGTDDAGAALIAEQMRAAVERLGIRHLGSREGVVTISAGVAALVPAGGGEKPHDLVAAADCALYQAKTAGRNRVRVTDAVGLR
jgi:diguanylate cyclase (GGDEF)-like protein